MQYYVPFLSALQLYSATDERLLFEFFEDRQPYGRAPLIEKIDELVEMDETFADMQRWRSSHIHPRSWLSVAWYPIYRIPMGASLKETSACFLAYYRIRMPGDASEQETAPLSSAYVNVLSSRAIKWDSDAGPGKAVSPFGLATYKLKADFAAEDEIRDYVGPMVAAARRWVDSRHVSHPDLNFFLR